MGGRTLMSGWRGRLLKEWTFSSQITSGTGMPETPIFLATVPGTGTTGTDQARPDGSVNLQRGGGLPFECGGIFRARCRYVGHGRARLDYRPRSV